MKTRERFEELLPGFVAGELTADETVEFDRLTADQSDWREEAREEQALVGLLRSAPRFRAPANLLASAKEKAGLGAAKVVELQPVVRPKSSRRLWNYAAAAIVVAGVVGYASFVYISGSGDSNGGSKMVANGGPSKTPVLVAQGGNLDKAAPSDSKEPGGKLKVGDIDNDGDIDAVVALVPTDSPQKSIDEFSVREEKQRDVAVATMGDGTIANRPASEPSAVARELLQDLESRRKDQVADSRDRQMAMASTAPSAEESASKPPMASRSFNDGEKIDAPADASALAAGSSLTKKEEKSKRATLSFSRNQSTALTDDAPEQTEPDALPSAQPEAPVALPSRNVVNRLLNENAGRVVADTPWIDTAQSFLNIREMTDSENDGELRYLVAEFETNRVPSSNRQTGREVGAGYLDRLDRSTVGSRVRLILPYHSTTLLNTSTTTSPSARIGINTEGESWRESAKRNRIQTTVGDQATGGALADGTEIKTYDDFHQYVVDQGSMFLYYTPDRSAAVKPTSSSTRTAGDTLQVSESDSISRLRDGYTGYLVFQFEDPAKAHAALNNLTTLKGEGVRNADLNYAEVLGQQSGARLVIPYHMEQP